MEDMLDKSLQGVVSIDTELASGTGFFTGASCLIVTNWHVVSEASQITIRTHSGIKRPAEIIAHSKAKDLALLRAPVRSCTTLTLQNTSPHLAEEVFVIGDPLGFSGSVSRGIVSRVGDYKGVHVLQLDASMNPGNSGGPVVNHHGEVVGVSTFSVTAEEGVGLNFATAASEVSNTFRYLLK